MVLLIAFCEADAQTSEGFKITIYNSTKLILHCSLYMIVSVMSRVLFSPVCVLTFGADVTDGGNTQSILPRQEPLLSQDLSVCWEPFERCVIMLCDHVVLSCLVKKRLFWILPSEDW